MWVRQYMDQQARNDVASAFGAIAMAAGRLS
jgi:hypothetical protein